jgi:hypothetical protein
MRRCCRVAQATSAPLSRAMSEIHVGAERPTSWKSFWQDEGAAPDVPGSGAGHPTLLLRKTALEWRMHHGHGSRLGSYGPTREIADFEHSDGTPSPMSRRRFTFAHHQDHLLVQMIHAAAAVEQAAEARMLPRVPGVAEQRDWDPEIPLFLDDADEHGKPPISHYTSGGKGSPAGIRSATQNAMVNDKFTKGSVAQKHQAINSHQPGGETLEAITMFASYDPASFIDEPIRIDPNKRPTWSRRRWAMSNDFLVPKAPKAKNTIKDA